MSKMTLRGGAGYQMKNDRIQTPPIGQVQKRREAWAKVANGLDHREGGWMSLGREGTCVEAREEKSNWP